MIWTFILDKNVGMWCRVKRAQGGRVVGGGSGSGADAGAGAANGSAAGANTGRSGEAISADAAGPEADGDGWKESELQN